MTMTKPWPGRRGFTLIELLVVIAIHRNPGQSAVAFIEPGEREGPGYILQVEPQATWAGNRDVRGR